MINYTNHQPKFSSKRIVQTYRSKLSVKWACQNVSYKNFQKNLVHFFFRDSTQKFYIIAALTIFSFMLSSHTQKVYIFFLLMLYAARVQRFTRLIVVFFYYKFHTFFNKRSRAGRLQSFTGL